MYTKDNNLIIENPSDFDIEDILECGQCFHFTKLADKEYELLAYGKYLRVKQEHDGDVSKVILYNTTEEDYEKIWKHYFDLEKDYCEIKKHILNCDMRLKNAIDAKSGIRILNQDFFETLISFIISQNKQIPHIKQIVHIISERYGDKLELPDGSVRYAFPTVEQLNAVSIDELRECKTGFRAPFIKNAVDMVYSGRISEDMLKAMSVDDAREKLMEIKGVGEKVANCTLLFGLGFNDVFPVDVWMKRIMEYMYFEEDTKKEVIEKFAYEKYGQYAGYAQQYLFFYGRENGIGTKSSKESKK